MKIRPIGDQVLVRQDGAQQFVGKSSLIIAPQGSEEWTPFGTVVAVGPGVVGPGGQRIEIDAGLVPGSRVMFKRKPGSALNPDSREGDPDDLNNLLMLREADIIGIVEE